MSSCSQMADHELSHGVLWCLPARGSLSSLHALSANNKGQSGSGSNTDQKRCGAHFTTPAARNARDCQVLCSDRKQASGSRDGDHGGTGHVGGDGVTLRCVRYIRTYILHFKYVQLLYVNFNSIKLLKYIIKSDLCSSLMHIYIIGNWIFNHLLLHNCE